MGLRYSAHCKEFALSGRPIDGRLDPDLAREINNCVKKLGIDIVLPGDAASTRSLIAARDLIETKCFPMPGLAEFDTLNNKWEFINICKSLGITCPNTSLFANAEQLGERIQDGSIALPLIAKPLGMDGGRGTITLRQATYQKQLLTIRYRPILVQEIIEGEDIGASVFCEQGEIVTFIAHRYHHATYSTFFDEAIYRDITKLMQRVKVDGVINFDMRLTPKGQVFYLECNPRFFFKIAMSMLAGINFVVPGLGGRPNDFPARLDQPAVVRFPKAMLASLYAPKELRGSWKVLKFLFSDPVPYLRDELGLENKTHDAWDAFEESINIFPSVSTRIQSLARSGGTCCHRPNL